MATAPQLFSTVERSIADDVVDVVIDLGALRFCDSSGLSFFIQAHQTLSAAGGSLVLHNPSDRLRGLLATTSLDHELNIS
jgi:anti-anti-sigma factor